MIGEISIDGVYVPALLLLVIVAVVLMALLSRLFVMAGLYRFVTYRPLADITLFLLLLAAVVWVTNRWGLRT
jgi:Protein of unknown function (DUF1656)